jgi:hypothetical protein
VDAGADGGFGHLRVAEQEDWRPLKGVGSVVGHRLELDAPVAGFLSDRLLVDAVGQLDGDMQPGGDAADSGFWERFGERVDERVTAAAVAGSHAAQVAVQLAAGQEVGERVLFDVGGPSVGEELLVANGLQ